MTTRFVACGRPLNVFTDQPVLRVSTNWASLQHRSSNALALSRTLCITTVVRPTSAEFVERSCQLETFQAISVTEKAMTLNRFAQ